MKKIWIIGAAISLTLIVGACSKQTQTTPSTTAVETTEKELADQASKEVEVMESLEADGKVIYDDESGDIVAIIEDEEEMHNQILDVLREEVKTGKLTEGEIEGTVRVVCDFLDEGKQTEFISELKSLVPQQAINMTPETQPTTQTKESQPAKQPTKSVPKETQSQHQTQPQVTEPVVEPEITEPSNGGEIDTSGWDLGGGSVTVETGGSPQNLTPEQIDAINNSSWN